jgi:hypothetical protein
MAWPV